MLHRISRLGRVGLVLGGFAVHGFALHADEPGTEPVGYESVVAESMFSEAGDPNGAAVPMESCYAPTWWEKLAAAPNLTGDWGGYRTDLMEHGIIYQGYLTQFYQGAAHGGREQDFQYGAKLDQFVILQGDKLGLWEGFFVNMHAETRMGQDVNLDAVGLAPVNANMLWPAQTQTTALSNLTFTQALSEEWLVTAGKLNTLDLFNQLYPQTGRGIDGFMNVSTLIPLAIARPLNLSVNGAGIMKMQNGQVQGTLAVIDAQNSSTTVGISDLFSRGAVVVGYWREFTEFWGLAGSHGLLAEISTRNYTSLDASDFYFDPNTGLVTATKSNTWALAYFGEQKLWVDCCNPKRNLGLFTGWGISDGNPNAIRWSGNISVQGTGLNSARPADSMGVGFFYTGLSGTFQNLVSPVVQLQDATGGELYYNMAVTQWLNVTPDLQIIQPSQVGNETAIVVGLRGKLTF